MPDDRHDPRLLTLLVAAGIASVVLAEATPPDPITQLLYLPVALALALPVAFWLVYRRGYDGPDVSLLAWLFPVFVPFRLALFLAVTFPLLWLGGTALDALSLVALPFAPWPAMAANALVALAALVAGQWAGFHGGWRRLWARLRGGPDDARRG